MQAVEKLRVENANLKTQRGCWVLFGSDEYDERRFIALYESPEDADAHYEKYGHSIKWKSDPHGGSRMNGTLKTASGKESSLYITHENIEGEPGIPYAHLIDRLNKIEADLKAALEKNAKLQEEIDDAKKDANFE